MKMRHFHVQGLMLLVGCIVWLAVLPGCSPKTQQQDISRKAIEQRAKTAQTDVAAIAQRQADKAQDLQRKDAPKPQGTLSRSMTLDEVVSYAINNNLEALAAAQDRLLQDELAMGSMMRMLPQLLVDAERSWKSQYVPSYSRSWSSGQVSLEPSISADLETRTENIGLSWDLVNLATSYFRYRQQDYRADIAGIRLKRVKQNVTLEVTQSYMRAAVAKEMMVKAQELIKRVQDRQVTLDKMKSDDLVSRNEWLINRIDLKEMLIRLRTFQDEFRSAKAKIAEQMGVANAEFDIAGHDFTKAPEKLVIDAGQFEGAAIRQRPELFE